METSNITPTSGVVDNRKTINIPKWIRILYVLFLFLSYFETYLTPFIGNSTKFLMLGIIASFILINHGKITLNRMGKAFLIWFAFLCITAIWSSHANDTFRVHFLTLLASVLFIFVVSGTNFDENFIRLNLQGHYWFSFIFGLLSILFHRSYVNEVFVARQVLTLFGQQNDPNNCAAFLVIGIALALYSIIYEKEKLLLNMFIIAVNGYAILLTASRAGFVSIGLIAIVFVFLPNQTERINISNSIKKLMIVIIGVSVIAYIGLKILPQASLDRIIMFDQYRGGTGRTEKWSYALELIKQRPIFGWGWGGYQFSDSGSTHNTFLTMWCDAGLVGLLLFVIPLLSMCIKALKSRNVLVIIILICGLFPSILIDAINKRFLWNAIILSIMLISFHSETHENVTMWVK